MEVITTKLNNGLTIATQNIEDSEIITTGVWVKSGSRNEDTHEHGLAHMLEHMAFKGTKTRNAKDIASTIENVGGEMNASTSIEITGYYTRLLKKYSHLSFEILSDILSNSIFDEVELEKEKQVVLQEIGSANDTPDDIVFDHFVNIAFQNQAIGRPILGTPQSVSSFKQRNFFEFIEKNYGADAMVLCGVGGIKHDEFVRQAERFFSNYRPHQINHNLPLPTYTGGEKTEKRDLMDSQIVLGFEGVNAESEDFYKVQLLSVILGGGMASRLFQNIREKLGICYTIYSFHWSFTDTGLFGISAASDSEGVKTLMPAIVHELKMLHQHISEEELNRSKEQYKTTLIMSQETSAFKAPSIARQLLMTGHVESNKEIFEKIDQITCQDLQHLAQRIFFNSRPSLAAVGATSNLISHSELSNLLLQ